MCTALNLHTRDNYFGRNLDLDRSYGEEVCVVPRRFPLSFRIAKNMTEHFAMIGMATVVGGAPLFYDAVNEHGVSMAGLNFPDNAYYMPKSEGMDNITPFEFIPWVLGQCKNLEDARLLLKRINLVDIPFSDKLPLSPLHWIVSFKQESIVVEQMRDGLHIHENPVGVLTNNPPFEYHLFNLNNYRGLSADNGEGELSKLLSLKSYCLGLGALGLPGDVSSMSRFVRAVFGKINSVCSEDEMASVNQFFHILASVEMTRGTCKTEAGELDITVYSSCINTDRGIYYYTTYDNRAICCIDMHNEDLDGSAVSRFSLLKEQKPFMQNLK